MFWGRGGGIRADGVGRVQVKRKHADLIGVGVT